jgi:hypothetical protein
MRLAGEAAAAGVRYTWAIATAHDNSKKETATPLLMQSLVEFM